MSVVSLWLDPFAGVLQYEYPSMIFSNKVVNVWLMNS